MTDQIFELYKIYQEHPVVCTDSRKITKGCLFFALHGDNFNGNEYAEDALQQGARVAIVDDKKFQKKSGFFVVDQVLETLQNLAAYHRTQIKATIIAITGTNGKTTTKELVRAVLSRQYEVMATEGNLNNHIGVPLTLLKMPATLDFGIVEMGANHPGEIAALCEIARPDFGLITNIGKAHLEGFGSLEGVLKAKTEMYRFIEKTGGKIFINSENKLLLNQLMNADFITYGTSPADFCHGHIINDFPKLVVEINGDENKMRANTNLIGAYNFENIMTACCLGKYFLINISEIIRGIESYNPDNLRSQMVQTTDNLILVDAYNANPSSMRVALENFARYKANDKLLILGEMLELGDESQSEHVALIEFAEQKNLHNIWLVGKGFDGIGRDAMRYFNSTSDLLSFLQQNKPVNKTILIKGSRGNQLEKILQYL